MLLAEETRPTFQRTANGLLVILRGVNMNPGAEPDELICGPAVWLEAHRVITLRQFRFLTIAELRGGPRRSDGAGHGAGFLAAVARGLAAADG